MPDAAENIEGKVMPTAATLISIEVTLGHSGEYGLAGNRSRVKQKIRRILKKGLPGMGFYESDGNMVLSGTLLIKNGGWPVEYYHACYPVSEYERILDGLKAFEEPVTITQKPYLPG